MRSFLRSLVPSQASVTRAAYLRAGLILITIKYALDAGVYALVVGAWWNPVDYLNPAYAARMASAPSATDLPTWTVLAWLLWGLVFAGLGTLWSTRRVVDAGGSPWWGMCFFIPYANYVLILIGLLVPSDEKRSKRMGGRHRQTYEESIDSRMQRNLFAAGAGLGFLALCVGLFLVLVESSHDYGTTAFLSLPIAYGVGVEFLRNLRRPRTVGDTVGFALLSATFACLGLLIFALEGMVCIAMAWPIVAAATVLGGLLGRFLATLRPPRSAAAAVWILALPPAAWVDSQVDRGAPHEVVSVVEIAAPPDVVWEHVVSFSELPEPDTWLFRTGIAYPMRARIVGEGVGAVRYCEFSTGPFVEPITVWDAPRRLAFDVAEQPHPMEEWSFYDDVHPPHLEFAFRSVRGEFRLHPTEDGGTRLEGSTWYELDMAPEIYWRAWSDGIIHAIHLRVLAHVKRLAEADVAAR